MEPGSPRPTLRPPLSLCEKLRTVSNIRHQNQTKCIKKKDTVSVYTQLSHLCWSLSIPSTPSGPISTFPLLLGSS